MQASRSGFIVEIPHAPALLQVRFCRTLLMACRSLIRSNVQQIVVSSGPRTATVVDHDPDDFGTRALRLPGDVTNYLVQTVMGFPSFMESASVREIPSPSNVVEDSWVIRCVGDPPETLLIGGSTMEEAGKLTAHRRGLGAWTGYVTVQDDSTTKKLIPGKCSDDDVEDDGFIAF